MNIKLFKMKSGSFLSSVIAVIVAIATVGCEDSKSYAEKLNDENKAVNLFLANHKVIDHIPVDTVFEVGEDAPYYLLDSEKSIYMQVLSVGNGEKAEEGQTVYFRYMSYPLSVYTSDGVLEDSYWKGNADDFSSMNPTFFKYDDYNDYNSAMWGTGIQQPLHYLPLNSYVNLVVKSQYGPTQEMSYVVPYLYRLRYFKSQI